MEAAVQRERAAHNHRFEQAYYTAVFTRTEEPINLKDYLLDLKTGEFVSKRERADRQIPAQEALKQWFPLLKSLEK